MPKLLSGPDLHPSVAPFTMLLSMEGHSSWLQAWGLVFSAALWQFLWGRGRVGREGRDTGCFTGQGPPGELGAGMEQSTQPRDVFEQELLRRNDAHTGILTKIPKKFALSFWL